MSRPLRAIIDHQALVNNLQRVRAAAPASAVMAVIKANGYGHGAIELARTLVAAGADSLAVIGIDEALRLRTAGIQAPITLLQGFYRPDELASISQHRLTITVHSPVQLEALEAANVAKPLRSWIKVDTGMHRLGFDPAQLADVIARLSRCAAVDPRLGLFSHLADADTRDSESTRLQIDRFRQMLSLYPQLASSLANSAGILGWPDSHQHPGHADSVRPGIMLYGSSPFADDTSAAELGLQPVMQLRSELIAVRALQAGDRLGYGGSWQCPEAMSVGLVACGYGDGYPRHALSGTPVLVAGTRVPLVGRVSMDTLCVDLRTAPHARVGDPVVLWGQDPGIDEVARAAGTIAYEPLTQITARVPLEHVGMSGQAA